MSNIFYTNTSSVEILIVSSSVSAKSQSTIDFSAATYVSGTFQGSGINLTQITASYINPNSTTSASYALTASYSTIRTRVVSSSFANPFNTNASSGDHFRTLVMDNFTLANPTNASDGQRIVWELIQDSVGGYTASYDTKFVFGADIPLSTALLNRTASKRDFIVSIYNQETDKFYVVGFNTGF